MDNSKRMLQVGHCYEYGIGVEKDENNAFIFYQNLHKRIVLKEYFKLAIVKNMEFE